MSDECKLTKLRDAKNELAEDLLRRFKGRVIGVGIGKGYSIRVGLRNRYSKILLKGKIPKVYKGFPVETYICGIIRAL